MPELPEVETTRRGIAPHLVGRQVEAVVIRQPRLRWPVPSDLPERLVGSTFTEIGRRAKYLLLSSGTGTAIAHLGMSGSLRIVDAGTAAERHDHIDIVLAGGTALRLRDPRRFGALLWTEEPPEQHRLLAHLGPEPLGAEFGGAHLYELSRGRRTCVRDFLLDGRVVAGVGNIYANEAAFRSGIDPRRQAGRVSSSRYDALANTIREVLQEAVEQGGTTLRDFVSAEGNPGYFRLKLAVYGRTGEECLHCGEVVRREVKGQRSLFYCRSCQS